MCRHSRIPPLPHLMQYCSGGELFDYIVARERLKVREQVNPLSPCRELSQLRLNANKCVRPSKGRSILSGDFRNHIFAILAEKG